MERGLKRKRKSFSDHEFLLILFISDIIYFSEVTNAHSLIPNHRIRQNAD